MPEMVHDMGGRERFYAPIPHDEDETAFHEAWEGRVHAMSLYTLATISRNIDENRALIEDMPEADYLSTPYYGRWLAALEQGMISRDHLAKGELDAITRGQSPSERGSRKAPPAVLRKISSALVRAIMRPMPHWMLKLYPRVLGYRRKTKARPRFKPGSRVVVVAHRPPGHTRVPGYTCGRPGTVRAVHGAMVFPDTHASQQVERPQALYTVSFDARDLWTDGEPGVSVNVDLFEPYLEQRP